MRITAFGKADLRTKTIAAAALIVTFLGIGLINGQAANAVTLVVTPNGNQASGTTRTVGAAWGNSGPYKVNFNCGTSIAGCTNFVSASTSATTYFQGLTIATCTGTVVNTVTTVWENAGAGARASGTTVTTFSRGSFCR